MTDFAVQSTDLFAAVIYLTLIVFTIWKVRAVGLGFPNFLLALIGYWCFRAAERLNEDGILHGSQWLEAVLDTASIVLLVYLLGNLDGLVNAVLRTYDEAHYEAEEYARARIDYEQLVRHRIFNPLTVIRGSAQTLLTVDDPMVRAELIEAIIEQTERLEHITLEPEQRGREERELNARPSVDRKNA